MIKDSIEDHIESSTEQEINLELAYEKAMLDRGQSRFLKSLNSKDEATTAYGASLIREYTNDVVDYISAWVKERAETPGSFPEVAALLLSVDIRMVGYITISTIVDSISRAQNHTRLAVKIASRIEDQARFLEMEQQEPAYYEALINDMKRRGVNDYKHKRRTLIHCGSREHIQKYREDTGKTDKPVYDEWISWGEPLKIRLGSILIDAVINATSDWKGENRVLGSGLIDKDLLGVEHNGKIKSVYMLKGTQKTLDMILDTMDSQALAHPVYLPTIIPPKDWTTPYDGGYHHPDVRKTKPLVRYKNTLSKTLSKTILDHAEMPMVYRSINALQKVPFRINPAVYYQLLKEWKRPDGIKIPERDKIEPAPSPLIAVDKEKFDNQTAYREYMQELKDGLTQQERMEYACWLDESREVYTKEAKRVSKRLDIYNTIRVAKEMVNHDRFYFVYTMDSRGRTMPTCSELSPQANKMAKALVQLANKKPIGRYKDWFTHLSYYIVQVWGDGTEKADLPLQVQWVREHTEQIQAVADNPDTTRDWWSQADDPWGFLAACCDYADILTGVAKGSDMSGCLVNQQAFVDGRCNGLQHFSMMLRDEVCGKYVGLMPGNVVYDIYTACSERVQKSINNILVAHIMPNGKHALDLDIWYADRWEKSGFVCRSLTKKPTMTYIYGGTRKGCEKTTVEITSEMDEAGEVFGKAHKSDRGYVGGTRSAGIWMTDSVWRAVNDSVKGTKQGMAYLRKIGSALAKHNRPIIYNTPLGFPVIHYYPDEKETRINVRLIGGVRLQPRVPIEQAECNKYKMSNALPPNFVHSMDATHLHMIVNRAIDAGIKDLVVIHDSFGCDPGSLPLFKRIIRETFVELYETNRLEDITNQIIINNPDIIQDIPVVSEHCEYGSLDIQAVKDAETAFM